MTTDDFNFDLPEELIGQKPISKRDESRLLVLDRQTGNVEHKIFNNIIDYMETGDCLVINDTKVIPARLFGIKKDTNGKIELLLLKRININTWETLVKPGKKCKVGSKITFSDLLEGEIVEILENGNRIIKFSYDGVFEEILDILGEMPLPPYIYEKLKNKERYQTVYAKHDGSSAAPTAGLHFTNELLEKLEKKGISIAKITLHVGLGTFRPVKVEDVENHEMHTEEYIITADAAEIINSTKRNGKRVIAVGTTSCRTLETIGDINGMVKETCGNTNIFIYPGYKFKVIDGLITNFHLPKSTLVMLVSAFSSKEFILNAYNIAIMEKYKFFSFGDAMFIR